MCISNSGISDKKKGYCKTAKGLCIEIRYNSYTRPISAIQK